MINIGGRRVGKENPVFITFEAGPTHNGLESAKTLAKHVVDAGGDAIKFQVLDSDRLVADREQPFSYDVLVDAATGRTETVTEPLFDILCRRMLSNDEWRDLKAYCDELNLAFFATVAFEDEVEFLEDLGCDSIKIASADVNHLPLIRRAARTGVCIQLDTGNSTLGEIETAVDAIRAEGNNNIIIHQCPSGYPARLESINLNIIPTLARMFQCPVAFSDHTPGRDMDIAAIAMGANLVEKTITLDRMTRSVEHVMSLEPADMTAFVQSIRDVEIAFGEPRRLLGKSERKKRDAVRRSVHLKRAVAAGEQLSEDVIEFRRPGYGIPPDQYEPLLGCVFQRDLEAGHRLSFSDLTTTDNGI